MSILETLCIALLVFSAFCALVEAVKDILVARAPPPACPCRDLHSLTLTPGSVFELPPGTRLTTFSTEGAEDVARAFKRAAGEVH
ncbi:hypothetical protein [Methylobacterium sp. 37f]|uniref:hypothetical protein n=1 Tax=Methylobacterium sp. 37f TaxID=2817058 RepID=UPI001FFD5C96|nr:hypothetical protein [Methylobacterium sp. 37f]MCK2057173.1 hypothetical protein [Methylobacterium sp. 37f]